MADDAAPVDISRLKRRRDFLRVAAERRKWVTPGLILQAAPMPGSLETAQRKGKSRKAKAPAAEHTSPHNDLRNMTDCPTPVSGLEAGGVDTESAGGHLCSAPDPVPAPPMARVGFTVSKKVGNAVHRNRARRRLRAVVDALIAELATPGIDYVVIGRVDTVDRPYDALLQDFRTAMKRVLTASKSAPMPGKGGKGHGRGKGRSTAPPAKENSPASAPPRPPQPQAKPS
ncbi:ribonuclease P protein component [Insolitispirillum peregrinum]|uniref:ribonuclease P protein component n=1 Tax=Insolitispirillum peregrinum TaxID=80876 RepID=UPI0036158BF8